MTYPLHCVVFGGLEYIGFSASFGDASFYICRDMYILDVMSNMLCYYSEGKIRTLDIKHDRSSCSTIQCHPCCFGFLVSF